LEWQRDLYLAQNRISRELRRQERYDEAFAASLEEFAVLDALQEKGRDNPQWREDLDRSVAGLGSLSYEFLLAQHFAKALEAADGAIAHDPDILWFHTNRAHALMMLGREDEARTLYLKYRGVNDAHSGSSWNDLVVADFAEMREAGIDHPLMREVESVLKQTHEPVPDAAQAKQTAP
jgi:tetratricopeptide (TPR) repeat protein